MALLSTSAADADLRLPAHERRRRGFLGDSPRHIVERLLCDHTIPIAVMVSMCLVARSIVDATRAVAASQQQRRAVATLSRALAAEEVAIEAMRGKKEVRGAWLTSWGPTARVDCVRDIDDRLEIRVTSRGEQSAFACDWLRGAAPACFATRLTLGANGVDGSQPSWLFGAPASYRAPWPQLALPPSVGSTLPGLFCDSEVAFLHLPAGTDRTDYTLGGPRDKIAPPADTQVVEVAGNLWILPSATPLQLALAAPLTIVVRGNVYLGRSLRVVGDHALTLVAHRVGVTFRDLDGDGAHGRSEPSIGDGTHSVEGDGSIYLGLPGVRTVLAGASPISVDAHLVAGGEVHLLASTQLHGALVGANTLTRCAAAATLELTGRRLVEVERARVPGFSTTGGPRPSRLRRLRTRGE